MKKYISVIPSARRLIDSLRNMGHDFHTAIADLVDNSVTANATVINIMISFHNNEPYVVISDDGDGMDKATIDEAMRFGSKTNYNLKDLGKYGLGLKTASLSFCDNLTVISKAKPLKDKKSKLYIRRWDLKYVYSKDDWLVNSLDISDLNDFEKNLINNLFHDMKGTIIIWTDMKSRSPMSLLYDDNPILKEKQLASLITETNDYLSLVFHRFIEGSVKGKARLKLLINNSEIEPWDPFFKQEKETIFFEPESFYLHDQQGKKHEIIFSPAIIPPEDLISYDKGNSNKKNALMADSKNNQQGFYFYRNDRLIKAGGWGGATGSAGIFKLEEHYKLLRIAVDFHPELDKAFNLNITKMSAVLPADKDFRKRLKDIVSVWRKQANDRYRKKNPLNITNLVNEDLVDNSKESISLQIMQSESLQKNKSEKDKDIIIKKESGEVTNKENNIPLYAFALYLINLLEDILNKRKNINDIDVKKIKKDFKKYHE